MHHHRDMPEPRLLPTAQLHSFRVHHHHRDKPEPRLVSALRRHSMTHPNPNPNQALHDRLSAIPRWRLSDDETVISRAPC